MAVSTSCTPPPTPPGFVRELFAQHGDEITDLEVRRASLEDTYMALVHRQESGARPGAVVEFEEVAG